jgi:hypothetical protein
MGRRVLRTARRELGWFARVARAPRVRTMRQFAEQEIILPTGEYAGLRYRIERQPFTGLLLDAYDSGLWPIHVITGPSQSSKTLSGSLIPLCYHLFELAETIVFGLPDLNMAAEKWALDIQPVIEASRYAELLPQRGDGSRRGKSVNTVVFGNGAVLKFMGAGGGDKQRAHFNSRVLIATEIDGFGMSGPESAEPDKLEQMFARLRSHKSERRRIYLECTVTTELGQIWSRYLAGTRSRIALRCPHCRQFVLTEDERRERELLVGYHDAGNVMEARAAAAFCCPGCGALWTEAQRRAANAAGVLVAAGQKIETRDERAIVLGDPPATNVFSMRWSPLNNLFLSAADIAEDEWSAARAGNEESAQRKLCQFVWAIPTRPMVVDDTPLNFDALTHRHAETPRGFVPGDSAALTLHIDLGKYLAHYALLASRADASAVVIDYGRFDVPSDDFEPEVALIKALRGFRDVLLAGWAQDCGGPRVPDLVSIDARYQGGRDSTAVYRFIREANQQLGKRLFWPTLGFGSGNERAKWYRHPAREAGDVKRIGERYHVRFSASNGVYVIWVDADYWKARVHERLALPVGASGALTLFTAAPHEHTTFVKHLMAEKQTTEFKPGKGEIVRWVRESRANHWLDCLYNAAAMASFCGVRLTREQVMTESPKPRTAPGEAGVRPARRTIRRRYQ